LAERSAAPAQGIVAEIPQGRRRRAEELERKARSRRLASGGMRHENPEKANDAALIYTETACRSNAFLQYYAISE
jgi:hypothetical protein